MRSTITPSYATVFKSLDVNNRTTWEELSEKIADTKDWTYGIKVGIKEATLTVYNSKGESIMERKGDRRLFLDPKEDIDLNMIHFTLCEIVKDNLWKKPRKKKCDTGKARKNQK